MLLRPAILTWLVGTALLYVNSVAACPFCQAVKPTLAQQREAAVVVALAEVHNSKSDSGLIVHAVIKGRERLPDPKAIQGPPGKLAAGTLVLVLGTQRGQGALDFVLVPVDEASWAYIAKAPDLRERGSKRLGYYAAHLASANSLVADDAFLEFAHAPFDQVVEVAADLPVEAMRGWIVDPAYPEDRKGFLGLVLGLTSSGKHAAKNLQLLERLVQEDRSDFRSGFDGVLAGYLWATGEIGLQKIEQRFLRNPRAADGDVRHAASALRFYQQYGREIKPERLNLAMRGLVARSEFAATAIADLARWEDHGAAALVVAAYRAGEDAETPNLAETRRAVIGYLQTLPAEKAAAELQRLRVADPAGVEQALKALSPDPVGT